MIDEKWLDYFENNLKEMTVVPHDEIDASLADTATIVLRQAYMDLAKLARLGLWARQATPRLVVIASHLEVGSLNRDALEDTLAALPKEES